jgi:ABC-type transport system involved in multi-copper enzyme maturation permease subunit
MLVYLRFGQILDYDRWLLEQNLLASGLLMGLAFAASGSFSREKQSGALELLLVSPLSVQQIIRGRLAGLASQFIPALCMVCLSSFFAAPSWQSREPTTLPVFLGSP